MKKCPTCERTFDDGLRFCQTDGTPLVDAAGNAPDDPFKTMVGVPPLSKEDDLLELPNETGTRGAPPSPFGSESRVGSYEDFSSTPLEIPQSNESPLNAPNFGDLSSGGSSSRSAGSDYSSSSPFDSSAPSDYRAPSPPFKEPEPPYGAQNDPFNQSPYSQQAEWTPPPAPVSNWQDQGLGANTPFQPPVAGGQNNTLAIVSLVCGILSVCLCGLFTGIPAMITGYMAKNNVDANPAEYGGRGMAVAGMILGGISVVFSILYIIFLIATSVTR